MSDLNHLMALRSLIQQLPPTGAYTEARQAGAQFLEVLMEADIRSAKPGWQPYSDQSTQPRVNPEDEHNWQSMGAVCRRVVEGLRRV